MATSNQMVDNGIVRRPVVAGYYYPSDPAELAAQVEALTQPRAALRSVTAVIVPHGSYRYSGRVSGATFGCVKIPRRCIILGPAHTNSGIVWSLMGAGAYRTPLGEVPIDERCAQALRDRCPFLETDTWAQHGEHAIEVLLPFLQRLGPSDLAIVPIVIGSHNPLEYARLAQTLAQTVRLLEEPVLLVASADFSHYQLHERAIECDRALIESIRSLDVAACLDQIHEQPTALCGEGAVASVLDAAKQLGATQAQLIAYGTSADAGGDPNAVTGFAGLIIH